MEKQTSNVPKQSSRREFLQSGAAFSLAGLATLPKATTNPANDADVLPEAFSALQPLAARSETDDRARAEVRRAFRRAGNFSLLLHGHSLGNERAATLAGASAHR